MCASRFRSSHISISGWAYVRGVERSEGSTNRCQTAPRRPNVLIALRAKIESNLEQLVKEEWTVVVREHEVARRLSTQLSAAQCANIDRQPLPNVLVNKAGRDASEGGVPVLFLLDRQLPRLFFFRSLV